MKACLEHWDFLSQKVASLHVNDIIGSLMMLLRNFNNHPRFWSFIYGGPQLSHQNQMLTSNSNRSQQIQITHSKLQITHSKLQITHSKLQIAHSKFKSPTANSNRPQQIQIVHSKLKSLTANSNCSQQITFR